MAFSISPGVNVSEIDLTTVVPATSTTEGALGGVFRWGPIGQAVLVENETILANRFGKPTNLNAETFFTGADFLAYGNKLYVSRAANTADANGVVGVLSAVANTGPVTLINCLIKNDDDFEARQDTLGANVSYIARFPGAMGNSIKVSQCENAAQFSSVVPNTAIFPANTSIDLVASGIAAQPGNRYAEVRIYGANSTIADTLVTGYANTSATAVKAALEVGDLINLNGQYLKVSSFGDTATVSTANGFVASYRINFDEAYTQLANASVTSINRYWEFYNVVDAAPAQSDFVAAFGNTAAADEIHVVVTDQGGQFTGVPGTILEVYQGLSRASNAKSNDGATLFYKNVLNTKSPYVRVAGDRPGAVTAPALTIASSTNPKPFTMQMQGGADGADEATVPVAALIEAYNMFAETGNLDVALVMQGKAREDVLAKHIKDNVVEFSKDCVATLSPPREAVVNNVGNEAGDITTWRNAIGSSSYIVFDSGYKYRYDKYNDLYRYTPLNGDIAGLMVRTDETRDPWFSPAGFNRGQLKNVVKLAYNPGQADRDVLYKAGINPVVTFPGEGTILYGDKTGQVKPSAFDRINVRRLFIVLEKSIARAAKYSLFEFNDEFTRAQFRSMVEPFLRDVQGRRGIYDFRVICDETNNTGEVIDNNRFVGDIYIKPARSINFIQLNFVAVRTGVEFSEVVGQF